ncbi:MAG: DNA polymerase III subunit delta' [Gammaproteobacteria bacterium]|nr:DNA polymerase III subunit delta' [Gammaproteobacteria bacterium]
MPDANTPLPLPWQMEDWSLIQRTRSEDRLPHALLLTGREGMGKRHFADALAASLLCSSPEIDGLPCGKCRGCVLFKAGTHPDLKYIEPDEPGKVIRIDTIRDFTASESLTAQAGGYKVVILEPADAMNRSAANSLLKTLEEPVAWTFMVLISSQPGKLPATIRSRCQQLQMRLPDPAVAQQWLAAESNGMDTALLLSLALGAPLKARALADSGLLGMRVKLLGEFADIIESKADPVAIAAGWSKLDPALVLGWYNGWLTDCLRLKTDPEYSDLINPDQRKQLQGIGKSIEFKRLFGYIDDAHRAILAQGSQLNHQMLLESLLLPLAGRGSDNSG